ncbi:hypothetical protein K461DRAFT_293683 [Myriangium duriaei CBS 260.36]|uniref:Uncharacterized protein n=1 Tax=Myriangium duriaei CBS 260.36 TaxID=1168546 RepID=A0A9P4MKR2_9PEZI|nr:hypothetical protein K461DRAFT_293683 [Myriangium duriaei CBS 260.36]
MGGRRFVESTVPALIAEPVDRLSKENYKFLKSKLGLILCDYYLLVDVAPEAPEKQDHGDIDFLVQQPFPDTNTDTLVQALDAVDVARPKGDSTITSFAVPYSDHSTGATKHAQVDLQVCPGNTIEWMTHRWSYSTSWDILGYVVRPFGFTPNDVGLYLRIEEGEGNSKKGKAKGNMLFLSSSPRPIVEFLGMSWAEFEAGFDTLDQLFGWLATCRLLRRRNDVVEDGNARDRARVKKRDLFRKFLFEWVPERGLGREKGELPSRAVVREEALEFFGKREEYEAKLAAIIHVKDEKMAADLIVSAMDEASEAGEKEVSKRTPNLVKRAVVRWMTLDGKGGYALRADVEMDPERQVWLGQLLDANRIDLKPDFKAWLASNWKGLKAKEKHRIGEDYDAGRSARDTPEAKKDDVVQNGDGEA